MGLSIVTPHYNVFDGLKNLYECLQHQTKKDWQWIVVDDFSESAVIEAVEQWINSLGDSRVHFVTNTEKTNASVCRNIGAETATFDVIVFVDSDDIITENFVENRSALTNNFQVFINSAVKDEQDKVHEKRVDHKNYLNAFLSARFIWPITAIVWNKNFFKSLGGFNEDLPRLQDVELAIRALQTNVDYQISDNEIDFYYNVRSIRKRNNFVEPVCKAVVIMVTRLLETQKLSSEQKDLLSGYYFNCIRYLERSGNRSNVMHVKQVLEFFKSNQLVTYYEYIVTWFTLNAFKNGILSGWLLLKINRKLFKPQLNEL